MDFKEMVTAVTEEKVALGFDQELHPTFRCVADDGSVTVVDAIPLIANLNSDTDLGMKITMLRVALGDAKEFYFVSDGFCRRDGLPDIGDEVFEERFERGDSEITRAILFIGVTVNQTEMLNIPYDDVSKVFTPPIHDSEGEALANLMRLGMFSITPTGEFADDLDASTKLAQSNPVIRTMAGMELGLTSINDVTAAVLAGITTDTTTEEQGAEVIQLADYTTKETPDAG